MRGVSGLPKSPVSKGEVLFACAETPPLKRIGRCADAAVVGACRAITTVSPSATSEPPASRMVTTKGDWSVHAPS